MDSHSRVWVAGVETLIGSALHSALSNKMHEGCLISGPPESALRDPHAVEEFFAKHRPEYVFLAAGLSGGIAQNQAEPATLMLDNLQVVTSVIPAAHRYGVRKLLYLASSCSYPRHCRQPMAVESLYTGPLEPTNISYAMAKLAGLELCSAFQRQYGAPFYTVIPANVFGPGDDFSPENSHVVGALLRKFDEAKDSAASSVTIWGSGRARREFIYAEDLADGCLFLMENFLSAAPINVGSGTDHSIAELARLCADTVGFAGEILFDPSRPDGMPEKRLDLGPLQMLGWRAKTPLPVALGRTYEWYRNLRNSL
jgi:GDP-L-fucose synthase